MTIKARTKICKVCGNPFEEEPKYSNKQWEARVICGFDCLSKPLADRFWSKIIKGKSENDCWQWIGAVGWAGYGQLGRERQPGYYTASRVSWLLHNGKIPDGLSVLHLCDNPPCCNPKHLFLGTQKKNIEDAMRKGRMNLTGLKHYKKEMV